MMLNWILGAARRRDGCGRIKMKSDIKRGRALFNFIKPSLETDRKPSIKMKSNGWKKLQ